MKRKWIYFSIAALMAATTFWMASVKCKAIFSASSQQRRLGLALASDSELIADLAFDSNLPSDLIIPTSGYFIVNALGKRPHPP